MTFATLRALRAVIDAAIDDIERVYRERSQDYPVDYPSLDEPYYSNAEHTPEEQLAESLKDDPAVATASMRIVAACAQLSTMINKPWLSLMDDMLWTQLSSAIRFMEAANIVEILRDAGPGGLHVRNIHRLVMELRTNFKAAAAPPDTSPLTPAHLAHILRLLVKSHYLREVTPDVFANNRMSSLLDTGKTLSQLRDAPEKKYDNTDGVASYVGVIGDEALKSISYLTDWALPAEQQASGRPGMGFDLRSRLPTEPAQSRSADLEGSTAVARFAAPFNLAFDTRLGYFAWFERTGNEGRLARFAQGMVGSRQFEAKDQVLHGFPWADLPAGSVLVDVGGGIGAQSILVAQAHPHIHVVVEDRSHVVSAAASAWGPQYVHLFESGRMSWRARDFFEAWPALDLLALGHADAQAPAVFLLRMILHDWNDDDCRRILSQLRAAAGPQTKLLLGDILLRAACALDKTEAGALATNDRAATTLSASTTMDSGSTLLPNFGAESITAYLVDIMMMGLFDGKERTVDEMAALTLSAGWKVVEVRPSPGSIVCYTTAVPV